MADKFSKETRSYIMSRIRGKDTKPEILVRKYLFARGLRFRKNDKRYPGRPDVVLPKYKTAVLFMDVSGIFMKDASMLKCQSPMLNTGRRNSIETGNVMHVIKQNLKRWDGLFLLSGSAN